MSVKKDSILLSLNNVMQVLTSLLFSVCLARLISEKANFGRYQQIFVLINFLTVVAASIPNGLSFFYGKYSNSEFLQGIFKRFFIFLLTVAVVTVLVYLAGSGWLALKLDNEFMSHYAFLIGGIALARLIVLFFSNFCLLTNGLKYFLANTVLYTFLNIGILGITYIFKFSIPQVLLCQCLVEMLRLVLLLPKLKSYIKFRERSWIYKDELKYLVPLALVALISNLYMIVDRVMISSLLGPADFADYQVGAFVFPFIGVVTGSVISALLPRISASYHLGDYKAISGNIKNATEKVSTILVPIFVYCAVFGSELITWMYSDKYAFSGYIFQIYTLRFLGAVVLFSMMMNAIGLQMWVLVNTIINLLINTALNFYLIKKIGVMGAVYAGIISTYAGYILPISIVNKRLKVGFLDYFPLVSYLKTLVISLLVALAFKTLYNYMINIKLWSVLLSSLYYAIVLFFVDRSFVMDALKSVNSLILKKDESAKI